MGAFCNSLTILLFVYGIEAQLTITNDRFYPRYHLAPPAGWMNDPNGFSVFRGEYHVFYQYNPYSASLPGTAHWGHAKSSDLLSWQHLPIAMYPNNTYDANGVFSGSALIENDMMYLYYTAHTNYPDQTPDHIERQALAFSRDGVNVEKYENNPIILADDRQPDIRDPKVWRHGDTYYMVLGNKFQVNGTDRGRVLLYSSKNKYNWTEVAIIGESDGSLGYMWECPDFFQLNGRFILLMSPQGLQAQGDKYKNLYQTGYIVGDFDYRTLVFKPKTEFQELDHGHDIYATQTILDAKGRRIVIAWFDMWENNYPEQLDGFNGHITIPRILTLTNDLHLNQRPVPEIRAARTNIVRTGAASGRANATLNNKAGEVNIRASASKDMELFMEGTNVTVLIYYNATSGQISLDRGGNDPLRRTEWRPKNILILNIYIDASSIEVFCGNGEVTLSSRYFTDGDVTLRLGDNTEVDQFRVFNMRSTVPINGVIS